MHLESVGSAWFSRESALRYRSNRCVVKGAMAHEVRLSTGGENAVSRGPQGPNGMTQCLQILRVL